MSQFPDAIQSELQIVAGLKRNALGPIHENYETLHGIAFLKEMYRRIREGRTLDEALQSLPFACLALTILNASTLLQQAAEALGDSAEADISQAAARLRWCDSILGIAIEISRVARLLPNVAGDGGSPGGVPYLDTMGRAFSALGEAVIELDSKRPGTIKESVRSGYLENPGARLVHEYKNVAWQISVLESARIAIEASDAAYIMALAELNASALAIGRDTYSDQFMLLHQMPELISFMAIELVDAAIASIAKAQFRDGERCIRSVNLLFPCINLCLRPLRDLMYPSEYYRFRENLGSTSGSHSKDLAALLLARKYEELARAFLDISADEQGDEDGAFTALRWQILEMRQNIYTWRDTHMTLPRNVLGAGATSLVGTKNATSSVERMRASFNRRDLLAEPWRPEGAASEGADALSRAGRQAEARLLDITGEIARDAFPDVEKRSGPVFGRQQAQAPPAGSETPGRQGS